MKGTAVPFMAIRRTGYAGSRSNGTLQPVSLEVCPKGARTSDVFP